MAGLESVQAERSIKEVADLFQAGRLVEADSGVRAVLRRRPADVPALQLAARIAHRTGDADGALAHLRVAAAVAPSCQHYCGIGKLLMAKGDLDEATEAYRSALAFVPDDFEALNGLGVVLSLQGRYDQAAMHYERLLEVHENNAEAHNNHGCALAELGRVADARKAFRRAIELKPDYVQAVFNVGHLLASTGNDAGAIEAFRYVVGLEPDHVAARVKLGYALRRSGDYAAAVRQLRVAVDLRPKDPACLHALGQALRWNGELEESMAVFRRATVLALAMPQRPREPEAKRHFSRQNAHAVLIDARAILGAAEMPFFLCCGTLLGVAREGDVMPFDKDMDIGMAWETNRQAVIDALSAGGVFRLIKSLVPHDEDRQWYLPFRHVGTGCSLDVFFFKPDGEHFLCGLNHRPLPMLSRPRRFDLERLAWLGREWLVPADRGRYLSDLYGPDWRQPDPFFMTILSSHCKVESSLPQRRCFGYARACEYIFKQQWRKADACVRQLLQIQHDPDLVGVQRALASRLESAP